MAEGRTTYGLRCAWLFMLCMLGCMWLNGYAQWPVLPSPNVAISNTSFSENNYFACTDKADGAIVVWDDNRNGNLDVFARRISSTGTLVWSNPVAVVNLTSAQSAPKLVEDGHGGALICWVDRRNGNDDLYAQRINASGQVQWTANGVAITTATGNQSNFSMHADGLGGAVIVWEDARSGNRDIYAQYINGAGQTQWTANGMVITNASGNQNLPVLCSDGVGGFIVAWNDRGNSSQDIYAKRVSPNGVVRWTANGISVCNALDNQTNVRVIPDGRNGAILVWEDYRNSAISDIYAQRIDSSGQRVWAANGVSVCTASGEQVFPKLASDGNYGAIITWEDIRSGTDDIYAQRVLANGNMAWTTNGVGISVATGGQFFPEIVALPFGKAMIVWEDARGSNRDIYVQIVKSDGTTLSPTNGTQVTSATGNQTRPLIFGMGSTQWLVAWQDTRNSNNDIYAQGLTPDLYAPLPIVLKEFYVGCETGGTSVYWETSAEINNQYFTLFYSADGAWYYPVAQVDGAGNSNVIKRYAYDLGNLDSGYVKLSQTDYDGTETELDRVTFSCSKPMELALYPNPVSDYVITSGWDKPGTVRILSVEGTILFELEHAIAPLTVPVHEFKSGLYIMQYVSHSLIHTQAFIVKR